MVPRHWELRQVVGSHRVSTAELVRRPAERKSNANSGLSSGAKTSAAVTRMCSEPQERLRGSSVTVQVGTGPGGGCRFSRAKDKLLRNLNKDL